MKLIIEVDENEVLDDQILEAIKGSARKIARESVEKELRDEIKRMIDGYANDKYSPFSTTKLQNKVKYELEEHIREVSDEITRIDKETVDARIKSVLSDIDKRIDDRIDILISQSIPVFHKFSDFARDIIDSRINEMIPIQLLSYIKDKMNDE